MREEARAIIKKELKGDDNSVIIFSQGNAIKTLMSVLAPRPLVVLLPTTEHPQIVQMWRDA